VGWRGRDGWCVVGGGDLVGLVSGGFVGVGRLGPERVRRAGRGWGLAPVGWAGPVVIRRVMAQPGGPADPGRALDSRRCV